MLNAQTEVERMISELRPFEEIEDYIDGTLLSEEQKSMLWFLAWGAQSHSTQRRITKETLEMLSG